MWWVPPHFQLSDLEFFKKSWVNEKRAPGCLGYSGGWNTTHLFMGIISYTHENKDLYMKKTHQDSMESFQDVFFLVPQSVEVASSARTWRIRGWRFGGKSSADQSDLGIFWKCHDHQDWDVEEIEMRCWDVRNQRKRLEQTSKIRVFLCFFSSDLAGFRFETG